MASKKLEDAYLKNIETSRSAGRAVEAPSGPGAIFKRGAFKAAVSRQGKSLQGKVEDHVVDEIMDNQSILRKKFTKN